MAAEAIEQILLSLLLEKYEESSNCLLQPEKVMRLPQINFSNTYEKKINKKKSRYKMEKYLDYQTTNSKILHAYNEAAEHLQQLGFLKIEYYPDQILMKVLRLQLTRIQEAYAYLGQLSPQQQVTLWVEQLQAFQNSSVPWLRAWQAKENSVVQAKQKLQGEQKKLLPRLTNLCHAFQLYEQLQGQGISLRSFSIKAFNDSKYFERELREDFLKIVIKYDEELAELEQEAKLKDGFGLSTWEKLAYVGIYARPELFVLSGKCQLLTESGSLDVGANYSYGLGIPSSSLENVCGFALQEINRIICIENKTCYDEFLFQEPEERTLIFYLGGFASKLKLRFLSKLGEAAPPSIAIYLWSDIDLGGFKIFQQLQEVLPRLQPYRMGAQEVEKYAALGLPREQAYLDRLQAQADSYPLFKKAIAAIMRYGVTIEQECFYQNK